MVKKYLIRILILLLIIGALVALIRFTPLGGYLNIQRLDENRDRLVGLVNTNYLVSVVVFILLYIVVVALSIPGASILSFLGGFFFGVVFATLYINIGATIGAFLVFLAARFFLGEMIQSKYGERIKRFNREIEKNGKNYLLTLRLIALFPFWLINLLAGVTKISPWTFVWTTSLGIIPGSAVYAYSGYAVAHLGKEQGAPRNVIFAFILLALLSLVPVIIKKLKARGSPEPTQ